MKDFKDLKSIQEGKYSFFQGVTKNYKIRLALLGYVYGEPQILLQKEGLPWIELPNSLSGSFTAREGKPYNATSLTLDSYYLEKLGLFSPKIEMYQDGDSLLFANGSFGFGFLTKEDNISIEELKYEECPVLYEVESTYTCGNNKIEILNLKYKSTYQTYRFLFNEEEWEVISFERYRDGGTTDIKIKDLSGQIHQFHQDTPFKENGEVYLILNGIRIDFLKKVDVGSSIVKNQPENLSKNVERKSKKEIVKDLLNSTLYRNLPYPVSGNRSILAANIILQQFYINDIDQIYRLAKTIEENVSIDFSESEFDIIYSEIGKIFEDNRIKTQKDFENI